MGAGNAGEDKEETVPYDLNADNGFVFNLLFRSQSLVSCRNSANRVRSGVGGSRLGPAVLLVIGPGSDFLFGA